MLRKEVFRIAGGQNVPFLAGSGKHWAFDSRTVLPVIEYDMKGIFSEPQTALPLVWSFWFLVCGK